ncbi:PAS domain-containing sensor histidine kinase [Hymenobacter endophyticus]|uniref:histidine kinase n=1 Tax=Hymenobacter endophyticus TaxID=3076335 RepID=A0ABU3TBL8_9BACT|nr:PAS domain-containing sensor histidine kinase [Hymenobacter endophyticus]MDU0368763.1 PAS domain-containing sensor histidine kinase [Hymenobacter endophyticus]
MLPLAAAAIAPPDTILRDLLAVSLTGIIFYTPLYDPAGSGDIVDFTFEYLNPVAQRMMSMPEVPTVTHNQQWPHSIAHGTFQFHVDAFVSGEPREYNINYQADGYDNYYRLAARRSGAGLLVSFTDTADQPRSPVEIALRQAQTAEKTARADAEAQRQRLHEVLMQLPAHVAVHEGPAQRFTLVNPAYQALAPGRTLLGLPIREAWPELITQGILDVLDQVYQTGEPYIGTEVPVRVDFTRTGHLEQVYYNFVFVALRDAEGQINGMLNFSYDVSEQVLARQQVERLNQELEARVQERTEQLQASNAELNTSNTQLTRTNIDLDNFIYTASHDLKSPISNLEGLLQLLQNELPVPVVQSEYVGSTLTRMTDAVERFKRTIEHLTEVSKLQKEHAPAAAAVNLGTLIQEVCLDMAPLIRESDADIVVAIADVPFVVFAEKNMRSVLFNLLSNALKYRHPARRPRAEIKAYTRAEQIVLEVQDNGLGLEKDQLPKLFGMFQRLHDHVEGTGIGLYMVKRMVENGGGRIEVRSQPGMGTTFSVYLPHPAGILLPVVHP